MDRVRRVSTRVSAAVTRANLLKALTYAVCWAVVAIPASYLFFFHDSQPTVIAGHDVTVSPTHDGYATADFGAYLPNFRYPTDSFLGVRVDVGKTNLDNYDALLQRYAIIASSPDGELSKVGDLVEAHAGRQHAQGGTRRSRRPCAVDRDRPAAT